MTDQAPTTSITLRALEGEPLGDESLRQMVIATAHAIAERQGIEVIALFADRSTVTATLGCGRIEAVGFAAELRRLTTQWYTRKYGEATLWGQPPQLGGDSRGDSGGDGGADWWKQA